MRRWLIALVFTCSLKAVEDFGVMEINGSQNESFSEIFSQPEYLQRANFIEAMPSQNRLSKDEALFMPSTQGDALKALKLLGGVTSLSDTTGELFIYGSKPTESSFSINHLPVGYLFHMGGIHSVISPEVLSQIDAYMAGFDVTYGNTMGGVIDVTPQYPSKEKSSSYGHLGIYDASAGVSVALSDKLSMYLGARRSYYDLFLDAIGESTGSLDKDDNITYSQFPQYHDITLMLSYDYDYYNHFSLELIKADDKLKINSYSNSVKDPKANGNISAAFGFTTVGTRWEYDKGNYSANTLIYTMQSYNQSEFYEGYFVNIDSRRSGVFHQSTLEYDKHTIVAGVEYNHFNTPLDLNVTKPKSEADIDYDFTTAPSYRILEDIITDSYSLFIEDIYSPTRRWQVRYGLRYDYSSYNNYASRFEPRVSLLYRLNTTTNLSASMGRYSQYPDGYKTLNDLGNSTLTSEASTHYVIHFDTTLLEKLHVKIEPFYKAFESLAVDDNVSNFSNSAKGYAMGIDSSLRYSDNRYYGFIAYTYLEARRMLNAQDSTMYRFYGDIPHTLQMVGAYKYSSSLAFSALIQYHSGKPYTKIVGTYKDSSGRIRPLYGEPYGARLPEYFTLNLKVAQELRFKRSRVEISFELMNLTNHDNISDIRYDDEYKAVGYYRQLPFLPWIDITYRF